MSITVTPINNAVLLQFVEPRSITENDSGLAIISDAVSNRQPISIVLAVPDEICDDRGNYRPSKFQAGDKVIFNRTNAEVAEIEGNRCLIVDYKDIFAVIK